MEKRYITRSVKRKLEENNNEPSRYVIWEGDDFNKKLKYILKKANYGDVIDYLTNNQLGVQLLKVIKDKDGSKTIKQIGDIYGNFDDPNHPDNI